MPVSASSKEICEGIPYVHDREAVIFSPFKKLCLRAHIYNDSSDAAIKRENMLLLFC